MNITEIRQHLFDASKLRMPRFDDRDTSGMRTEKLENYLLLTSRVRGDLEEGRLYMQQALRDLDIQWKNLTGWELFAPAETKARTGPAIERAKRMVDPAIADGIDEAKWLIARLTEQINRLSHMGDDQVASRIYTLIAGS